LYQHSGSSNANLASPEGSGGEAIGWREGRNHSREVDGIRDHAVVAGQLRFSDRIDYQERVPGQGPQLASHWFPKNAKDHGFEWPPRGKKMSSTAKRRRLAVASILVDVADGRLSSAEALFRIRQLAELPWTDQDLADAFEAMQHFDSDADIRHREPEYEASQIAALRAFADVLRANAARDAIERKDSPS
jgi:hypothetical protein